MTRTERQQLGQQDSDKNRGTRTDGQGQGQRDRDGGTGTDRQGHGQTDKDKETRTKEKQGQKDRPNPREPSNFRPTALTSYVGKLHQSKLASIIQDARTKHKSLTVCWLDLKQSFRQ